MRRPHILHLEIDDNGWLMWSIDCPYSATEVDDQPGRPCNLVQETTKPYPSPPPGRSASYSVDYGRGEYVLRWDDTHEPVSGRALDEWNEYLEASDEWERWEKIPGCFVRQYLEDPGFEDIVCLGMIDPRFPIEVDVVIDGYDEDAYVQRIVPWKERHHVGD